MSNDSQAAQRPLVLFDGGCPLCRREIAHYRRLPGSDAVEWQDLDPLPDGEVADGVTRADAMARFHVRDPRGNWHSGVAAFVVLWRALPRYRWLARAVTLLRLTRPLDVVYGHFARRRLVRRCDSSCAATGRNTALSRREQNV